MSNSQRVCRFGGRRLSSVGQGKSYEVCNYAEAIEKVLKLNVHGDKPDVHPPQMCSSCRRAIQRASTEKSHCLVKVVVVRYSSGSHTRGQVANFAIVWLKGLLVGGKKKSGGLQCMATTIATTATSTAVAEAAFTPSDMPPTADSAAMIIEGSACMRLY